VRSMPWKEVVCARRIDDEANSDEIKSVDSHTLRTGIGSSFYNRDASRNSVSTHASGKITAAILDESLGERSAGLGREQSIQGFLGFWRNVARSDYFSNRDT
jgi:hypothetical protein